jgi:hypothetical protein
MKRFTQVLRVPYSLVLLFAIFQAFSCKKDITASDETGGAKDEVSTTETLDVIANGLNGKTTVAPATLFVNLTTSRILQKDQTFIYQISVKRGNQGVPNFLVTIDDPIRGFCTQVYTNNAGTFEYRSKIPGSKKGGSYQHRIYIRNAEPIISTVAVRDGQANREFKRVKFMLASTLEKSLDKPAMNFSERVTNIGQTTTNSVEDINYGLGRDLRDELLTNPYNKGVFAITAASCLVAVVAPPVGAVPCTLSGRVALTTLGIGSAKVMLKRAIEKTPEKHISKSTKAKLYTMLDAGDVAIGLATLKVDKALNLITITDYLATLWDFEKLIGEVSLNSNGSIRGVNITGVVKNGSHEGTMCVMTFVKK